MLVDRSDVLLEQLGNQSLRKPDRALFKSHLDAAPAVLRLIEDDSERGSTGLSSAIGFLPILVALVKERPILFLLGLGCLALSTLRFSGFDFLG